MGMGKACLSSIQDIEAIKRKKAKYELMFKILLSNTIIHQSKANENLVTTHCIPTD